MTTREEYNRDHGRAPVGGSTSSASPDNNSVPIRTPGPAVGVTEEGKKQPIIVQRAVAEVETLQFSEEGRQGWNLLSELVTGDLASVEKQIATNEIERQRHFIKILERDYKDPRPRIHTPLSGVLSILRNPIGF